MNIEDIARRFCLVCHALVDSGRVANKTEFCSTVNLRVSNYNLIEKGVRTACLGRVCDVVNVYGVSVVWLMTGEGSMFEGASDGKGDI